MERRREIRFEVNEPVVVAALGSRGTRPLGGLLCDVSGQGILMKIPCSFACGTLLRVETSTLLLLGEVVRCQPDGNNFRVAIAIRHSLLDLKDLENLNRSLLGREPERERESAQELSVPIMKM